VAIEAKSVNKILDLIHDPTGPSGGVCPKTGIWEVENENRDKGGLEKRGELLE